MATGSQGIYVHWNGQLVAEVVSVGGPSGSAPVIDVSHLKSVAAEKLLGLMDEGQLTLEVNYIASDTAQAALIADRASGTKRAVNIFLAGEKGQVVTFDAYCSGCSLSAAMNQAVRGTMTLEIDGEVDYSPLLSFTSYDSGTDALVVGIDGDTFHANAATTSNWTPEYGTAGYSNIVSAVRDSSVAATITFGVASTGTHDIRIRALAAALTGSYGSGRLRVTITSTTT